MPQQELMLLAQLGAHRAILVRLLVLKFLGEPDPVGCARAVRELFRATPVVPPREGSNLDPATSDLLASMTDEEIDRIMGEVVAHLERRNAA